MIDPRPTNCRHRLKDEGKPFPKSRCFSCGQINIVCPSEIAAVKVEPDAIELEAQRLKTLFGKLEIKRLITALRS